MHDETAFAAHATKEDGFELVNEIDDLDCSQSGQKDVGVLEIRLLHLRFLVEPEQLAGALDAKPQLPDV